MLKPSHSPSTDRPLRGPVFHGKRRPKIALVAFPRVGAKTLFAAAASTEVQTLALRDGGQPYQECIVELGMDEATLQLLPPITSLHEHEPESRAVLRHLAWGHRWPESVCGASDPNARGAPDVLIHVVDATALERSLALTQELSQFGRPMVIALNRMDEARKKGLYINIAALSEQLGVPVVPTVAHMGKGIAELIRAAMDAARRKVCPVPQPPSAHIANLLPAFQQVLTQQGIAHALQLPMPLLLTQIAGHPDFFHEELARDFPDALPALAAARSEADRRLPRPLAEEVHADRHHRAATLFEAVTRLGGRDDKEAWKLWLDDLFLHPRWGLIGSIAVFAVVLFVVFKVSTAIDSVTSAPLGAWVGEWTPESTTGVVGRAVADGMVGLIGIVIPYMLPLVLLLVALEESGVMHRVAFVVDRGFHRIGLHGGVAVPFLLGLGCNVPAISAAANSSSGRERIVASLLITFVPCSARSAIILAIGGKYLGVAGVLALFALTLIVIAVAGRLLMHRYPVAGPGLIQQIPPYAWPQWRRLGSITWERTSDIVTIVTPLLVAGSIVLALLNHVGADTLINTALQPFTLWWLGLPLALGVPILFGVLRKELSLVIIYQALGTQEIGPLLDTVQIATFLVFLTFYVPCISTFAVMLKLLGRREAVFSVVLSVGTALVLAGAARWLLTVVQWAV